MSQFIVQPLKTKLIQTYNLSGEKNYNVAFVKPYFFLLGIPAGTFTITIRQGDYSKTATFTAAAIQSALSTSDTFIRAWYRLAFTNKLSLKKGNFTLELTHSGYTFSPTSYIAWIQEHEFRHNDLDADPVFESESPLACQLLVYRTPESF